MGRNEHAMRWAPIAQFIGGQPPGHSLVGPSLPCMTGQQSPCIELHKNSLNLPCLLALLGFLGSSWLSVQIAFRMIPYSPRLLALPAVFLYRLDEMSQYSPSLLALHAFPGSRWFV